MNFTPITKIFIVKDIHLWLNVKVTFFTSIKLRNMADFNDIIYKRRSIRKFSDKSVEKEKTDRIIKAGLLAPSGKRMFPAEFIVIDDKQILKAISESKEHGAKFIKDAPLAIIIAADTKKYDVWIEDSAVAATFILLAAENEGLGACWVQMRQRFSKDGKSATENLSTILNLKPSFEILSIIGMGYNAENKEPHSDDELKYERVHHNKLFEPYYHE